MDKQRNKLILELPATPPRHRRPHTNHHGIDISAQVQWILCESAGHDYHDNQRGMLLNSPPSASANASTDGNRSLVESRIQLPKHSQLSDYANDKKHSTRIVIQEKTSCRWRFKIWIRRCLGRRTIT